MKVANSLYIVIFKGKTPFKFHFISMYKQDSDMWYKDLENEFNKRLPHLTYNKENIIEIKRV